MGLQAKASGNTLQVYVGGDGYYMMSVSFNLGGGAQQVIQQFSEIGFVRHGYLRGFNRVIYMCTQTIKIAIGPTPR